MEEMKSKVYQYMGETCFVKNNALSETYIEVCETDFIFMIDEITREIKIDYVLCKLNSEDFNDIISKSHYIGEMDFYEYTEHRRKFLEQYHGLEVHIDDESDPTFTDQSGLRAIGVTFRKIK